MGILCTIHLFCNPLHQAIKNDELLTEDTLNTYRLKINEAEKNTSRSPLNLACRRGHVRNVQTLLNAGVHTTSTDKYGFTPLETAIKYGHYETTRTLLQNGASIDQSGRYPLFSAIDCESVDLINLLESYGADLQTRDQNGNTLLHELASHGRGIKQKQYPLIEKCLQSGININARNHDGDTPLHIAASKGNVSLIEMFVHYNADPTAHNHDRHTMLDVAIQRNNPRMVKALVKRYPYLCSTQHTSPTTPLHQALYWEHYSTVKELLQNSTHVGDMAQKADREGRTPLHIAALFNDTNTAFTLIPYMDNINRKNNQGSTPLHHFSLRHNASIVKHLIHHGAHVNTANNSGKTPLHYCAQGIWNNKEHMLGTMSVLLANGAHIHQPDNTGWTPLGYAIQYQNHTILELLIQEGAHMHIHDNDPSTAVYHAFERGDPTILTSCIEQYAGFLSQVQMAMFIPLLSVSALSKAAITRGFYDKASEQLNGLQDNAERAELLLHAETRAMLERAKNSSPLRTWIYKNLNDAETVYALKNLVSRSVKNYRITPSLYQHIIERYGEAHDKLSDVPQETSCTGFSCSTPYQIIHQAVYGTGDHSEVVKQVAHRARERIATLAELQACIEHIDTAYIQNYYDAETGNTFLHEIAHTPGLVECVSWIAEAVIHNQKNPYNKAQQTPMMIAKRCHNSLFLHVLRMYHAFFVARNQDRFTGIAPIQARIRSLVQQRREKHAHHETLASTPQPSSFVSYMLDACPRIDIQDLAHIMQEEQLENPSLFTPEHENHSYGKRKRNAQASDEDPHASPTKVLRNTTKDITCNSSEESCSVDMLPNEIVWHILNYLGSPKENMQ